MPCRPVYVRSLSHIACSTILHVINIDCSTGKSIWPTITCVLCRSRPSSYLVQCYSSAGFSKKTNIISHANMKYLRTKIRKKNCCQTAVLNQGPLASLQKSKIPWSHMCVLVPQGDINQQHWYSALHSPCIQGNEQVCASENNYLFMVSLDAFSVQKCVLYFCVE